MKKTVNWRLPSHYIGAGRFVLTPDRAVLGTETGVQCISRSEPPLSLWEANVGSRCLGVAPGRNGTFLAACVDGLHVFTVEGAERWGTHSLQEIVHGPVPFRDGVLLTSRRSIHAVREWGGSEWRFDFGEILGTSVEKIRMVNLFDQDGHVVAGVVDYDTGIGRVVVLSGKTGRRVWMSDPGPVTEVFSGGQGVFVWSQTGYGRFETRMTRIDGLEVWQKDFAGFGTTRADGSIGVVVGSNESPAWDDWEYRQISAGGKLERTVRVKGRCPLRPTSRKDGTVYVLGMASRPDAGGARSEHTRFLPMPQEVLFQHLTGIRPQLPEHEIWVQRIRPGATSVEVIYQQSATYCLADLQALGTEIVFCDARDIIAVDG